MGKLSGKLMFRTQRNSFKILHRIVLLFVYFNKLVKIPISHKFALLSQSIFGGCLTLVA